MVVFAPIVALAGLIYLWRDWQERGRRRGVPPVGRGAPEPDRRRGPPGGARRRARLPRLPALRLRRPRLLRPAPQPPLAGQHRLPGQVPGRLGRPPAQHPVGRHHPPPLPLAPHGRLGPGAPPGPGGLGRVRRRRRWSCSARPGEGGLAPPPGAGLGGALLRLLRLRAEQDDALPAPRLPLLHPPRRLGPGGPLRLGQTAGRPRPGPETPAGHLAAAGGPGPGGPRRASPAPCGPSPSPASTPAPSPASAASQWIYENVPKGSVLANEHWDDPLPLPLPGYDPSFYRGPQLPLYDPDEPKKLDTLVQMLSQSDYINLTSNRLYGSIPRMPQRYPMTTEYYRRLFAGDLGFELVATFASYPTLGPWTINDDRAEEAFTVYDHPKVLIFKKTAGLLPGAGAPDPLRGAPGRRAPDAPHPGRADAADDAGGPPRGEHRRGHLVGHVLPGRPGQPPGPPAVVAGPDRPGLARRPPAVAGPAPPARPRLRPGSRPGAAGRLLDRLVPRRLPPPALDAGHPPAGRAPAGAGRRADRPARRAAPGAGVAGLAAPGAGAAAGHGGRLPRRLRPVPAHPRGQPRPLAPRCGGARSRWSSPTSTR